MHKSASWSVEFAIYSSCFFKAWNLFFQLNSSWQTFFGSEFFAPHIRVYNKQEKMHLLVSSPLCF